MKLRTLDNLIVSVRVSVAVLIGFVIGFATTRNSQADLEAEYERGRFMGFVEGADEAISVVLDARFNQNGSLVARWRNCVKESFGDNPIIGKWIDSLTSKGDSIRDTDSVIDTWKPCNEIHPSAIYLRPGSGLIAPRLYPDTLFKASDTLPTPQFDLDRGGVLWVPSEMSEQP